MQADAAGCRSYIYIYVDIYICMCIITRKHTTARSCVISRQPVSLSRSRVLARDRPQFVRWKTLIIRSPIDRERVSHVFPFLRTAVRIEFARSYG